MAAKRRMKAAAMLAPLVAGALTLAACGSSSGGSSGGEVGSKEFPASVFPKSTFGGLSGSLTMYDASGGEVTAARTATIQKRFAQLTGVKVVPDFSPNITKFLASEQAGQVPWSVVEMSSKADVLRATKAGYLQKLDTSKVPLDKLKEGTYTDYAIPQQLFGFILVYNKKKWPDSAKHPTSATDIFDTKDFPGKRCLSKYPQFGGTLETALLADGVSRENLYPLDVNRAIAKLDTIKKDIVWWNDGASSVRYLTTGECDMGIIWSGRAYAAISQGADLGFTWNDGGWTNSYYGIPKGAPNTAAGEAFLAMNLLDKKSVIALTDKIPYPTPLKDIQISEFSPKVGPFLPLGENIKNSYTEDEDYYVANIDKILKVFNSWLAE